MKQTAQANKVLFVDCFTPSQKWYEDDEHSVDVLYNDYGYVSSPNFSAIQFLYLQAEDQSHLRAQGSHG